MLGKGQGKVRCWSGGQVNVRWTPGQQQVKFKISDSKLGKGLGKVRWCLGGQVIVKSNLNLSLTLMDVKLVSIINTDCSRTFKINKGEKMT